jgi:hypothetical protein
MTTPKIAANQADWRSQFAGKWQAVLSPWPGMARLQR